MGNFSAGGWSGLSAKGDHSLWVTAFIIEVCTMSFPLEGPRLEKGQG